MWVIKMELILIKIWRLRASICINKINYSMNYSSKFNSKTLMREFINQVQIENTK